MDAIEGMSRSRGMTRVAFCHGLDFGSEIASASSRHLHGPQSTGRSLQLQLGQYPPHRISPSSVVSFI